MRGMILLIIINLMGCGQASDWGKQYSGHELVSLRLHGDVTDADVRIIGFAAHMWDDVGAHFRLESEESGGELLDVYLTTEAHLTGNDDCPLEGNTHAIGCYRPDSTIIISTVAENEYGCMAHELGHAMGIRHQPTPGDLMYYIAGNGLTDEDILAYDAIWNR